MGDTHILCFHCGGDAWVTVWKGFLAVVSCAIAAFMTQNLLVWEERRKKKTEKENPSAIESHVTQQKKSARFINTEVRVGGG